MILHKYVNLNGDDIIRNLRIKVSKPTDFNDPFEYLPHVMDISPEQMYDEVVANEGYLQHLHKYGTSVGSINKPYESYVTEIKTPAGRTRFLESTPNIAKALRVTCKDMQGKPEWILMTCFCSAATESNQEILMWSHYAYGHRGLRIAFDKELLDINDKSFIEIKYEADRVQLNPLDYLRRGNPGFTGAFSKCIKTKSSVWLYEKEYRWLVVSAQCHKLSAVQNARQSRYWRSRI